MKGKYDFFKGIIVGVVCTGLIGGLVLNVSNIKEFAGNGKTTYETKGQECKEILESEEFATKYNTICDYIDKFYLNVDDVNTGNVEDGMLGGMIDSLGDKYAEYYNKEEYEDLMEKTQGQYGGIGAYVSQNPDTGNIVIVNPFKGAPADKAGIKSGDIITDIDGKSVAGLELDEVTSLMKGEAGTKVNVKLYRDKEFIEVEIEREIVDVPLVDYELIAEYNIGYIYVSAFDIITIKQFREAVDALEKKGADGLVIDIRNNGGGVLDAVIDMLDRMLPEGLIMYTENKQGKDEEFFSSAEESYDKPYAVLINGYSASASEVFAGAVQDYGYGTIVGTQSFGKGVVQTLMPITEANDGSAIKITTSKYYTPNGRNIDGIGIEPDVKIEYDKDKDIESGGYVIDNQLQEALRIVMEKANN